MLREVTWEICYTYSRTLHITSLLHFSSQCKNRRASWRLSTSLYILVVSWHMRSLLCEPVNLCTALSLTLISLIAIPRYRSSYIWLHIGLILDRFIYIVISCQGANEHSTCEMKSNFCALLSLCIHLYHIALCKVISWQDCDAPELVSQESMIEAPRMLNCDDTVNNALRIRASAL